MNKVIYIGLFIFIKVFIYGNTVAELIRGGEYSDSIVVDDFYPIQFAFGQDRLHLTYDESNGYIFSIPAYRVENDEIALILKARWVGRMDTDKYERFISSYYLVRFTLDTTDQVLCDYEPCTDLSLSGFSLNKAVVNAGSVNIRSVASLDGKIIYRTRQNEVVSFERFGDKRAEIGSLVDYWLKVTIGKISGWVFGYYVDFSSYIEL